jgi:hypothetical protein
MERLDDKRNVANRPHISDPIPTLLAINGIIVLILIGLALSVPSASEWISAAAQAEFVVTAAPPVAPTQLAQPTEPLRTTRAD